MVRTALWEWPVPVSPECAKAPARGPTPTITCGSSAERPFLSSTICGVSNRQDLRSTRRAGQGSDLQELEDFVAGAFRQCHGSNQRETIEPPLDRVEHGHWARFAGIAQQGHVRHEGLRVEADPGFPQCAAQLGDERFELGGNDRGTRPRNAVVLPVTGPIQHKRNRAQCNRVRSPLDFRNLRLFHAAEKSESHMQILRTRRPAAAHRMKLARPVRKLRAHGFVGPQREEQPHGASKSECPARPLDAVSSSAIASAAMPSPRPMAPRCSAVLALTFTWRRSISRSAAMFATIAAVCGAIFGACATMVASRLTMENPARRTCLPR